jgi:hypothetical protein
MALENDPERQAIFKGEPHQLLLLARFAEFMEKRIAAFTHRVLNARDESELKMTDAKDNLTITLQALTQREKDIEELQARLDREFALSERLKAQIVGLKGEIAAIDAANKGLYPNIRILCSDVPSTPEQRERAKSYLRAMFS